jgi:hypothetical protein
VPEYLYQRRYFENHRKSYSERVTGLAGDSEISYRGLLLAYIEDFARLTKVDSDLNIRERFISEYKRRLSHAEEENTENSPLPEEQFRQLEGFLQAGLFLGLLQKKETDNLMRLFRKSDCEV